MRRLAGIAERERMARDVHDVIGRTLTLVALKADLVERLAVRDGKEALSIAEQARAGFAEIRASLEGRAGGSFAVEITASIAALRAAGIQTEVHGDPTAVSPGARAILAMTLREAVTNVIRHAGADLCTIELACHPGGMTLTVTDNGTGVGAIIVEGNGLTGMRQRLVAAGGGLITRSGVGMTLIASMPA